MNLNYQLILGSKSPRRKSLLESLGLKFELRAISVDEDYPEALSVTEVAKFLSKKKASVHELKEDELLITADTVVILDGEILGKPNNHLEAYTMLSALSAKTHIVTTGVTLTTSTQSHSFSTSTEVTFDSISTEEINHYITNFKPFDKAGAYGIQEWIGMIGIKSIKGDYYNVVGLPLIDIWKALKLFK